MTLASRVHLAYSTGMIDAVDWRRRGARPDDTAHPASDDLMVAALKMVKDERHRRLILSALLNGFNDAITTKDAIT